MKKLTLANTVHAMLSKDWKDRFVAEFLQNHIRKEGLEKTIKGYEEGTLPFTPKSSLKDLKHQLRLMNEYEEVLISRAKSDEVEIPKFLEPSNFRQLLQKCIGNRDNLRALTYNLYLEIKPYLINKSFKDLLEFKNYVFDVIPSDSISEISQILAFGIMDDEPSELVMVAFEIQDTLWYYIRSAALFFKAHDEAEGMWHAERTPINVKIDGKTVTIFDSLENLKEEDKA